MLYLILAILFFMGALAVNLYIYSQDGTSTKNGTFAKDGTSTKNGTSTSTKHIEKVEGFDQTTDIQGNAVSSGTTTNPQSYNPNSAEGITYNTYTAASDLDSGLKPGQMYFPNPDGTFQVVDIDLYDQTSHNYETGSFSIGERNFSPNYEPSSFISKLGSLNVQNSDDKTPIYLTGSKVVNTDAILGGFCKQYANDPQKLEEMCRRVNPESCASTECCALLGGQRCVSANESGPIMKSNYSDFLITNPEFYYYQGKCYGNCK